MLGNVLESVAYFEGKDIAAVDEFLRCMDRLKVPHIDVASDRVQIVEASRYNHFARVYIYGDMKDTYWACCDYADSFDHRIAFVGNIDSSRNPPFSVESALPFQTPGSNDWRCWNETLARKFREMVDMSDYPVDWLRRIVSVCHLGVSKDVEEEVVRRLLRDDSLRVEMSASYETNYAMAMTRIQELSRDRGESEWGDRLLQRVMLHLLYLSVVHPRRESVIKNAVSAVRRLVLS